MDFETSCWSTGPLTNVGGQSCYKYDNPVQRRPKIDYFDSASITPIVSHISSNGYYGYCPTPNVPTNFAENRCNNDIQNNVINNIDIDVTDSAMVMDSANSELQLQQQHQQQQHQQHQGRPLFENRKRTVQCVADEFAERDAKRRRSHLSVIDYVEDMQMGYDDDKDITIDPSNIASKQLPLEPLIVCINTDNMNMVPVDQLAHTKHQINYSESNVKYIHDNATTIKKTDEDNSPKECITNDMENLYWHTHGSLLWQR